MMEFHKVMIDSDRIYNNIKTLSEKKNVLISDIEKYSEVSQGFISRIKDKNSDSDFIKHIKVLYVASVLLDTNIENLIFDNYQRELDEKQKQLLEVLENLGVNKKQAIKILRRKNNG